MTLVQGLRSIIYLQLSTHVGKHPHFGGVKVCQSIIYHIVLVTIHKLQFDPLVLMVDQVLFNVIALRNELTLNTMWLYSCVLVIGCGSCWQLLISISFVGSPFEQIKANSGHSYT